MSERIPSKHKLITVALFSLFLVQEKVAAQALEMTPTTTSDKQAQIMGGTRSVNKAATKLCGGKGSEKACVTLSFADKERAVKLHSIHRLASIQ